MIKAGQPQAGDRFTCEAQAIHLCDTNGAVLSTIAPDIQTPGFDYTSYLLWNEFANRSQEKLQLA